MKHLFSQLYEHTHACTRARTHMPVGTYKRVRTIMLLARGRMEGGPVVDANAWNATNVPIPDWETN